MHKNSFSPLLRILSFMALSLSCGRADNYVRVSYFGKDLSSLRSGILVPRDGRFFLEDHDAPVCGASYAATGDEVKFVSAHYPEVRAGEAYLLPGDAPDLAGAMALLGGDALSSYTDLGECLLRTSSGDFIHSRKIEEKRRREVFLYLVSENGVEKIQTPRFDVVHHHALAGLLPTGEGSGGGESPAGAHEILGYDRSPVTSEISPHTVYEITPGGRLRGKRFEVQLSPEPSLSLADEAAADGTTFDFTGPGEEAYFAQASLYKNAEMQARYFNDLGFWNGGKVKIFSHNMVKSQGRNDAHYTPSSVLPAIYVGEGDGRILQNLMLDADVVQHELGHHVLYAYLKDTDSAETVTLHEGLADYFVLAFRGGDRCFAESVCPPGAKYCFKHDSRLCLRRSSEGFSWDDPWLVQNGRPPHTAGMVISSLLLDFGAKVSLPPLEVSRMAAGSVQKLSESAGVRDFLLAVMHTLAQDRKDVSGCKKFTEVAAFHGLSSFIGDVSCEAAQAVSSPEELQTKKPAAENPGHKKKKLFMGCGTLGGGGTGSIQLFFYALMPILITSIRSRRK